MVSNESDVMKTDRAWFNITENQFYVSSKNQDDGGVGARAAHNQTEVPGQKWSASVTLAIEKIPSNADILNNESLDESYAPGDDIYVDEEDEVLDEEDAPD